MLLKANRVQDVGCTILAEAGVGPWGVGAVRHGGAAGLFCCGSWRHGRSKGMGMGRVRLRNKR